MSYHYPNSVYGVVDHNINFYNYTKYYQYLDISKEDAELIKNECRASYFPFFSSSTSHDYDEPGTALLYCKIIEKDGIYRLFYDSGKYTGYKYHPSSNIYKIIEKYLEINDLENKKSLKQKYKDIADSIQIAKNKEKQIFDAVVHLISVAADKGLYYIDLSFQDNDRLIYRNVMFMLENEKFNIKYIEYCKVKISWEK